MVSTVAPSDCTASIRQPRTISPFTHGAGAADAVLAADVGAGERQIVAQEIDQRLARFHALADGLAVDGEGNVSVIAHHCASMQLPSARAGAVRRRVRLHCGARLHVIRRIEIERGDSGIDIAGG